MDTRNDQKQRRCPRLGGPVNFAYCRQSEREAGPCFKLLDCWWEFFDIRMWVESQLGAQALKRLSSQQPPSKVSSLVQLIREAQQRCR